MNMCTAPLETFSSFCRRYHSLLLITFCSCLLSSIKTARTFEAETDNTSDNLPIQMTLNFTVNDNFACCDGNPSVPRKRPKLNGPNFHLK